MYLLFVRILINLDGKLSSQSLSNRWSSLSKNESQRLKSTIRRCQEQLSKQSLTLQHSQSRLRICIRRQQIKTKRKLHPLPSTHRHSFLNRRINSRNHTISELNFINVSNARNMHWLLCPLSTNRLHLQSPFQIPRQHLLRTKFRKELWNRQKYHRILLISRRMLSLWNKTSHQNSSRFKWQRPSLTLHYNLKSSHPCRQIESHPSSH